MDFTKPQFEVFGLQISLCYLCCCASQRDRASSPCVLSGSTDACIDAPSLWEIVRIEIFRDRCHVVVGSERNVGSCALVGVMTKSHSQIVWHTGYGRRDRWSSRLGRCSTGRSPAISRRLWLLTEFSHATCWSSKSVIEPSVTRIELFKCGMRGASWESVFKASPSTSLCGGNDDVRLKSSQTTAQLCRRTTLLPKKCLERRSSCAHGCNNTCSSGSVSAQPMVNPCFSAFRDLDLRFHRRQREHHSFECFALPRCFRERWLSELVVQLGARDLVINQPSYPLMSHTLSSRLLCSTLDVGTSGLGDCSCCVQFHAGEVRGLSCIIKTLSPTPLPDVLLSRARWTLDSFPSDSWWRQSAAWVWRKSPMVSCCSCVVGMSAGHDRSSVVFACKIFWCTCRKWRCSKIPSGPFGTILMLTGRATNCCVCSHWWMASDRRLPPVGVVTNPMRSNLNLRVFWKPVNLQSPVWENLYQIIMKTILWERVAFQCNITIWFSRRSFIEQGSSASQLNGKGNLRKSFWTCMVGRIPNWECLFVHREKNCCSCLCMWILIQQTSRCGRTNIFLGSCALGMHSEKMWKKQRYCGQLQNHVRIENFRGWSREIPFNSLQHRSLVHKLVPMPQPMKISCNRGKQFVERMGKIGKCSGDELDECQNWERGDRWSEDERRKVHFALLMDICHLTNAELERKHQKYKGRIALRSGDVKDDSGSFCSIQWTRIISITNDTSKSHGCRIQTAWFRWTSSRRSISLYPNKNIGCTQIAENSQIGAPRHLDPSTSTQMVKIMDERPSCFLRAKSAWSSFARTVVGKAIWENPIATWLGDNSKLGMFVRTSWKRIILVCVCGWHKIVWKEMKSWPNKQVDLGEPTFLGSCALGLQWKTILWETTAKMFKSRNSIVEELKMTVLRSRTRRFRNSTKYPLHVSMTTISEKKQRNLLENCHMYAP